MFEQTLVLFLLGMKPLVQCRSFMDFPSVLGDSQIGK